MTDPDPTTLVRRRSNQRDIGIAMLVIAGVILAISPWRLRLMPTWIEIVIGVILAMVGVYNFLRSHRLPTQEVMVLIRQNGGLVTQALLVEKMGLEPDNAEEILRLMHFKGILRCEVKSAGRGQNMTYYHINEPNPSGIRAT